MNARAQVAGGGEAPGAVGIDRGAAQGGAGVEQVEGCARFGTAAGECGAQGGGDLVTRCARVAGGVKHGCGQGADAGIHSHRFGSGVSAEVASRIVLTGGVTVHGFAHVAERGLPCACGVSLHGGDFEAVVPQLDKRIGFGYAAELVGSAGSNAVLQCGVRRGVEHEGWGSAGSSGVVDDLVLGRDGAPDAAHLLAHGEGGVSGQHVACGKGERPRAVGCSRDGGQHGLGGTHDGGHFDGGPACSAGAAQSGGGHVGDAIVGAGATVGQGIE